MSDISLEPLANRGTSAGQGVLVTPVSEVGAVSHRTPITVTSTAQEITIGALKTAIELHNSGTKTVYYGGSGVTSSNGIPIYQGHKMRFEKVKTTFSIYLVTNGADTSEVRIVEYS